MKYSEAGVDLDRGREAVRRIQAVLRRYQPAFAANIGRFGGFFPVPDLKEYQEPMLVASIDGAGTKTLVAAMANRWDVVGSDVINHGVNDILVQGAVPLFALDYIGTGRLNPDRVEQIVEGMARSCRENGLFLIGGETAEMPDIYEPADADVVAVIVGLVDRSKVLGPHRVRIGDRLIGIASTGLHTNGYTLARRIFFDTLQRPLVYRLDECGMSLGEALLQPHRSYYPLLRPFLNRAELHALAHITGGGLTDNLPRVLPENGDARIHRDAWQPPPLFKILQTSGEVSETEMFRTFNMGVGMVVIVEATLGQDILATCHQQGVEAWEIGEIVEGSGRVVYQPPLKSSAS